MTQDEYLVSLQIALPEPMKLSDVESGDGADASWGRAERHDLLGHLADWLHPIVAALERHPQSHVVAETSIELQWRTYTVAEAEILGEQAMALADDAGYGIIGSAIVPYMPPSP